MFEVKTILLGEVEILKPTNAKNEGVKMELTLEQNSFFIGSVCDGGKSVNAFVPDNIW